jgi:septal ring factor EnvC (AmiA/AmiB activator)
MTQAIEASDVLRLIEKVDTAIAVIQADVTDIKISQAKADERLQSIETQLNDLKLQVRSQDNRLWTFVGGLFLTVLGFLAKFAFFPGGQP